MAISEQQQIRMIVWTGAVVLLLSTGSALSMLQPPPQQIKGGRGPASTFSIRPSADTAFAAVAESMANDPSLMQSTELSLPCPRGKTAPPSATIAQNIKQVRINGTTCPGKGELESIEIGNLGNGFSATVFQPTPKTFTTDYISLNKGANTLHIVQTYKDGERAERTVVIERE